MKTRTKLLSMSVAALATATVGTAPAFGDDGGNNFVLVSWSSSPFTQVAITEMDNHSQQLRETSYGGERDSKYWKTDQSYPDAKGDMEEVFLIHVSGGYHDWNVYPKGVPANAANDPNAVAGLPACFRVSRGGDLHPAQGDCNTKGASEGQW